MESEDERPPEDAAVPSTQRARESGSEGPSIDHTRTSTPPLAEDAAARDWHPALSPLVNARFRERYEILAEHGRGGLGRVSRALDRELDRHVAIKELISRNHLSEMRFLREALITARLEHPGIVPIHEAGRWPDGTPFYAMKLVAGRPLRDLIAERHTVEDRLGLLHHVIAVADAIAYAHDRSIIHRDLKPSNIIIGDFGETVVIDWGLAKDLTVSEELPSTSAPQDLSRLDGLTNTGSVLGTPSYMPPEQERGEQVDQRADVFAIGAMLWELCALQKVPPVDPRLRHRILRRAHIDPDLVIILDKALATDRAQRYPHAGALVADLKAFKSGARIAARNYSLFAILVHWTRHHRALTLSLLVLALVGAAVSGGYVHNITAARDRADAALAVVEATQGDLALEHAELQLRSDPTAAVATLRTYHGTDKMRFAELSAEAYGRGVARSILHPHNDTIWFLVHQSDGSFISLGEDHRIQRIRGASIVNLASNVSSSIHYAYSPAKNLLAYAAFPSGMSVLRLADARTILVHDMSPIDIAFSSDGARLAAIDRQGNWKVWQHGTKPVLIAEGQLAKQTNILFTNNSKIVLYNEHQLTTIDLEHHLEQTIAMEIYAISASDTLLVIGLANGSLISVSDSLVTLASTFACHHAIQTIKTLSRKSSIIYGCDDGHVGIVKLDPISGRLESADSFETKESTWLLATDTSENNILAGGSHTIYIHHLQKRTTMRLTGHAARISALAAIDTGSSSILVGDASGTLRVWPAPTQEARVVAQVSPNPFGLRISPDSKQLAIYGIDPALQLVSQWTQPQPKIIQLRGHTDMISGARYSPDGRYLASYSRDGTARAWDTSNGTLLRTFDGHHATPEDVAFLAHGEQIITIGDDGHMFAWSPYDQQARTLFTHELPLISMQVLAATQCVVVRDARGGIWSVSTDGRNQQIRAGDAVDITMMRASSDGRWLAIGNENGEVSVYRTTDWQIIRMLKFSGSIARIEFSPHDPDLLIASEDGYVHHTSLDPQRHLAWQAFKSDAKDIAYDPSGEIISISTIDGGSWFYSIPQSQWSFYPDHEIGLKAGQFSPQGVHFSVDLHGVVIARMPTDLHSANR